MYQASASRPRSRAVRAVHGLTGAVLGLFLGVHAYQQAAVLEGRDTQLARLELLGLGTLLSVCLALLLATHSGLALWLARVDAKTSPGSYPSRAFRRFQAMTGLVALLYILVHAGGTWWARATLDTAASVYAAVLDQTGSAMWVAFTVLGLSAACLHLGQGLSATVLRTWPGAPARVVRSLAGLCALVVWFSLFRALAVYATGSALM